MKKNFLGIFLSAAIIGTGILLFSEGKTDLYRLSMKLFQEVFSREDARQVFGVEEEEYVAVFGNSEDEDEVFL